MRPLMPNDHETKSADILAENIEKLKALFPEALTEGKIDFDILKQLLGGAVDEREEKYGLNWHGKRRARQLALTPSTGTLRPCPEESVDWDTTQNLMIEGDNLEVLKLLQKSYAGKVKLIYIDPPYNTGKDFVYPDDFHDNIKNYLELTGQVEGGKKISSNTEASGRFHTDWLNMMYPRLKLARNLLRPDGLIFISIDDGEVATLRIMLNEIFGEENFEGNIHWRRRHNQPNDPTKMIALVAEHIICYARDKVACKASGVGKIALTGDFSNPDGDPRGDWASKPWKVGSDQSGTRYKITTPTDRVYDEEWMGEMATYETLLADNRIIFPDKGNGAPRKKYFKSERELEGQSATNWWPHEQFGNNQAANGLMEKLFGEKNVFSNPKPIELLNGIIDVGNAKSNDIIIDFFAGSGTAAHAVMSKNADGDNRRYVLIQLPEPLDPNDKDQKIAAEYCDKISKPRNIAELTKERLRRAGEKIRQEFSSPQRGEVGRGAKAGSTSEDLWLPTPVPAGLLEAARNLRKSMTDAEQLLWQCLRGKQLDGYKFRKQHPIEKYVLDFYCPAKKLAIELDGSQHNTEEGKIADTERTRWLNQQGIRVLRFWNHDVLRNISGVIQSVWDALHEISPPPLPPPLPPPRPSPAGGGSFKMDVGFRVFKLDSTNIRAWDPAPGNLSQALLDSVEHLKSDRSEADVLYELLLKLGLDLCVPIEQKTIAGKTVHSIGAGTLVVCLAPQIGGEEVEPLALGIVEWRKALAPTAESTVVFRDSAFDDDVAKTNLAAILQQHGLENVRSL